MDIIGKSPVSWPELILGKVALFTCTFFFLLKATLAASLLFDSPVTYTLGIILYSLGIVLVLVALVQLGRSAAVGLPDGATTLKTHGLYRYSRNPIYLSGFMACVGSCLMAIHPLNLLCLFLTVVIHHRIVLREEEFLLNRFGQPWVEYRNRVRRYI